MDSFSTVIRTASHDQHVEAETSTFMSDLLGGRLGVDAYARYTEQLWFVYEALEAGAERLAADPVAGAFIQAELFRLPALERDLAHLRGADWRSGLAALPATQAYADRVRECAEEWPAGYIAHHYTRYLGDLSGGQIIRDKAERTWGSPVRGRGAVLCVRGHREPGGVQARVSGAIGFRGGRRPGEAAGRGRVQAGVRAEHRGVPCPG